MMNTLLSYIYSTFESENTDSTQSKDGTKITNDSYEIVPSITKKTRKKTIKRKLKDKIIKKKKRRAKRNADRKKRMLDEGITFGYDNDTYANEIIDERTNEDDYYDKKEEWIINNNNKIKHSALK